MYQQQILFDYSLPASAQAAGLDTPTLAQRRCPWVPAPHNSEAQVFLIPSTSATSDPGGPEWKLPDGHRYEWTPDESSSVDHHRNPRHILRDAASNTKGSTTIWEKKNSGTKDDQKTNRERKVDGWTKTLEDTWYITGQLISTWNTPKHRNVPLLNDLWRAHVTQCNGN